MNSPRTLNDLPDPITPAELAEVLRIGKSTAFDLLKAGRGPRHLRVGSSRRARILIYKADLAAWIEANKTAEACR